MFKRVAISIAICSSLSISALPANAGLWQSTKESINAVLPWKHKHLDRLSFEEVYPKAFYQKNGFVWVATGSAVVGAGLFTYFTSGAGAPAAATGVSSFASWVAGGGAGAYMSGLSTVGGWFGGNAILGAAILNGISLGIVGGGAAWGTLGIAAKIGVLASVTATSLDGVMYFQNPETNKLEYRVRVKQPEGIGSKETRKLIASISEIDERIAENLSELFKAEQQLIIIKDEINVRKQKEVEENIYIFTTENQLLQQKKQLLINQGLENLKSELSKDDNQENLLVLSVLAWNQLETELFSQAINKIDSKKLKDKSFLNYLLALNALNKGEEQKLIGLLDKSMQEAPYAIEPILLYLNVVSNTDFDRNKILINTLVKNWEDNFDPDDYSSNYSLVSLYYRLGTMFFLNKDYETSANYYNQAYDNMRLTEKFLASGAQLKRTVKLGYINSLYMDGKTEQADKIYNSLMENIESKPERENFMYNYAGNSK